MLAGTDGIDFDTVVLQVGKGSDDSRFAMAASCLKREKLVGRGWYCSQRYHFTSGQNVVDGLLVGHVLHMATRTWLSGSSETSLCSFAFGACIQTTGGTLPDLATWAEQAELDTAHAMQHCIDPGLKVSSRYLRILVYFF